MRFGDWSTRIAALTKLSNRLSRCFSGAQREFVPPLFRPLRAPKTQLALIRGKHLQIYQAPLLYMVLLVTSVGGGVFLSQLFYVLFPASFFALLFYKDVYAERFAQWKTSTNGVDGFNVPYLQLLTRGFLENAARDFSAKDEGAAPLTKSNLASVIKLEKAGHDVIEINYGSSDIMRRVLQTAVVSSIGFVVAEPAKAQRLLEKLSQTREWPLIVVYLALCGVGLFFAAYVNEALSKAPRRRFLMVLNLAHETWPNDLEVIDPTPHSTEVSASKELTDQPGELPLSVAASDEPIPA